MPYIEAPSGLLVWEGEMTPKEEIEFYRRVMGNVKSFPSTSRPRPPSEAPESQQKPPQEE